MNYVEQMRLAEHELRKEGMVNAAKVAAATADYVEELEGALTAALTLLVHCGNKLDARDITGQLLDADAWMERIELLRVEEASR